MMSLKNSRRSGALYALVAGSLMASEAINAQAPAPEVVDALQTASKYGAYHAALARLFPEPYKTVCLQDTKFNSPEALAIAIACKDTQGADPEAWNGDCSPECTAYFEKLGGDCELLEDAAKSLVAGAYLRGQVTTAETEALFAWYNFFNARYYNETTDATESDIVEHLEQYKNEIEGHGPAFLAALKTGGDYNPKYKLAYMDKCGDNYTAALGSEEALRGALGVSSAVRATALAGVAFFFAALV